MAKLQNTVKVIWLHRRPDVDDLIALWIVKTFGLTRFPDIFCADIRFVDPHEVKEDYATLLAQEILCIGFGGGPFDEHSQDGDDGTRIGNECAASLVARALGVRDRAGVKQIVDYALQKDNSADTKMFELGLLVKMAFRYLIDPAQSQEDQDCKADDIMCAVYLFLDAMWKRQLSFEACVEDFDRTFQGSEIPRLTGGLLRVASVVSSNPEIGKYCRSKEGGHAAVVIQRQEKTGHTQIFFDHRRIDAYATNAVIRALRIAELIANQYLPQVPYEALIQDGAIEGAEAWYYEASKRLILNGSLTQSRPPTKLRREEVERIVDEALRKHFAI